jgi:hypothetical protein
MLMSRSIRILDFGLQFCKHIHMLHRVRLLESIVVEFLCEVPEIESECLMLCNVVPGSYVIGSS